MVHIEKYIDVSSKAKKKKNISLVTTKSKITPPFNKFLISLEAICNNFPKMSEESRGIRKNMKNQK